AAGHAVAFACPELQRAAVETAGFEAFAVAPHRDPPARKPLVAVDEEREEQLVLDVFLGTAARERVGATLALCESWRPGVVVCEEFDAGSMVAAQRHGVPFATVLANASGSFVRRDLVLARVDALRAEHGLPAGDAHALLLSPFPPSFRSPPPGAVSIRPVFEAGPIDLPEGAVFFTLGTVFNLEAGDLFTRVLAGLRPLDEPVVVAVGHGIEPDELGPQPPHVHVVRYVPLGAVLPRCTAVVSHAGSGLVAGTLAFGLPSVAIPMGADQPGNARRLEALGLARALEVMSATPDEVREAVRAVLGDPSYREAAERIRDEIARLPGPDHAVARLNTLSA
ncbi:MAG TPA: glycosyltransferase, partial [Solirubrobacteraceae bacterium]|nr:glycosyltransferase [Solirubrobacteraceae bacterium]